MNELIYNQKRIPKGKWRYGLRSSAATGCGWIATYNALRLLGYRTEPEALIRYYERMLPLIHGNLGTTMLAPAICLGQMGFRVKVVLNKRRFDRAVKESRASILFFRWHRRWKLGAHFVALEYREGRFVGYNTFHNSVGPDIYGESLTDFLKRKKYFCPVIITIDR